DAVVSAIFSTRTGLPVPMVTVGEYNHPYGRGRMKTRTVFLAGDIFSRDGAVNVSVGYGDWPVVQAEHNHQGKEGGTSDVTSLMSKLADAMAGGGQVNVPLEPFLADDALSSAIRANIRHGNRAELKILSQNARAEIVQTPPPIKPSARLVGVGCEAMLAD